MKNSRVIADRLGEIAAIKAELAAEEKALKAVLTHSAGGSNEAFEGELFRATVSFAERTTTNWKKVAEKLSPSRQLIAAHTSTSPVTTVRVSARNNVKVAA